MDKVRGLLDHFMDLWDLYDKQKELEKREQESMS
jgi:hypothetical protein